MAEDYQEKSNSCLKKGKRKEKREEQEWWMKNLVKV